MIERNRKSWSIEFVQCRRRAVICSLHHVVYTQQYGTSRSGRPPKMSRRDNSRRLNWELNTSRLAKTHSGLVRSYPLFSSLPHSRLDSIQRLDSAIRALALIRHEDNSTLHESRIKEKKTRTRTREHLWMLESRQMDARRRSRAFFYNFISSRGL